MRSTVQCNTRINPELRDKFKEFCRQQGKSQDNAIEEAIRLYISGEEKERFSSTKNEMNAILTGIKLITENSTHLAERLEDDKVIHSEEHIYRLRMEG